MKQFKLITLAVTMASSLALGGTITTATAAEPDFFHMCYDIKSAQIDAKNDWEDAVAAGAPQSEIDLAWLKYQELVDLFHQICRV